MQQKKNENECIYSNLCILPPYQGSYDAFLVDFGKKMLKLPQNLVVLQSSFFSKFMFILDEVESVRLSSRPKKTWRDAVEKDCRIWQQNEEDAIERSKWRKLIRDIV